MLFTNNLEKKIFNCHSAIRDVNNLVILSGYVGPVPIDQLKTLPFPCKVVYGMYGSDGISQRLHDELMSLQTNIPNIDIYYSNTAVHSKCYAWRNDKDILHTLIGSANFSSNGLKTPFREMLTEATADTFDPLEGYIEKVLGDSVLCTVADITAAPPGPRATSAMPRLLSLLTGKGGMHTAGGLNWGHGVGHTRVDDAYIPIFKQNITDNPGLFPPKTTGHNDTIEILWDDGTLMECLLEGNQDINGIKYPKQISSSPAKSTMGEYFHNRIGVPLGQAFKKSDLVAYGRTDVDVAVIGKGLYEFDFHV